MSKRSKRNLRFVGDGCFVNHSICCALVRKSPVGTGCTKSKARIRSKVCASLAVSQTFSKSISDCRSRPAERCENEVPPTVPDLGKKGVMDAINIKVSDAAIRFNLIRHSSFKSIQVQRMPRF